MMTSQDLVRLEAELLKEDLVARRRTNNRRDVSRNERFCRDSAAQTLKDLDIGSIEHHLEKINTDILIAELLQNAILAHVKEEDQDKEEDEYHSYCHKMLATRKSLTQQLVAARLLTKLNLCVQFLHSLKDHPELMDFLQTAMKDLNQTMGEVSQGQSRQQDICS